MICTFSELFEIRNSAFIGSKFSRISVNSQNKAWCINEVLQEKDLDYAYSVLSSPQYNLFPKYKEFYYQFASSCLRLPQGVLLL